MSNFQEINFDGLVGPTHHYGGLSRDNLASDHNRNAISNPQKAALQGLQKMKTLADLGFPQAVLPPLRRPSLPLLESMGFCESTPQLTLKKVLEHDPKLLSAAVSASSMWTANAATVAPSCDTTDQQLHLVTANLISKLHRSIEASETLRNLQSIFGIKQVFPSLIGGQAMGDEGAANHTRLCPTYGARGIHVFVYGRSGETDRLQGQRFEGRQTLLASQSVARRLKLDPQQCVFLKQNQDAIDAGVFHNDVIAVGNLDCYFSHEKAYENPETALEKISYAYSEQCCARLHHIVVPDAVISVEKAVKTYLFNSQLVGPSGNMTLIAPQECREDPVVSRYLSELCNNANSPIRGVRYFDLRESMRNGGGPACLRLRVVMKEQERVNLGARVMLDEALYDDLTGWVRRHYRESLEIRDFADPGLLDEIDMAFRELKEILEMPEL